MMPNPDLGVGLVAGLDANVHDLVVGLGPPVRGLVPVLGHALGPDRGRGLDLVVLEASQVTGRALALVDAQRTAANRGRARPGVATLPLRKSRQKRVQPSKMAMMPTGKVSRRIRRLGLVQRRVVVAVLIENPPAEAVAAVASEVKVAIAARVVIAVKAAAEIAVRVAVAVRVVVAVKVAAEIVVRVVAVVAVEAGAVDLRVGAEVGAVDDLAVAQVAVADAAATVVTVAAVGAGVEAVVVAPAAAADTSTRGVTGAAVRMAANRSSPVILMTVKAVVITR